MKDPREGSPFFPGEAAIKHPHLLYADLISPTISFNPLVPLEEMIPDQVIISISGPPGTGKTSLAKELKKIFGNRASIAPTYTTRGKRTNEKKGMDANFVTDAKFKKMREAGEFLAPNGTDLSFDIYEKKYGRRVSDLTKTPIVIVDSSFRGLDMMKKSDIATVFSIFIKLDRPREEWEKIIRSRKEPEKIVQKRIKSGIDMMRNYKNINFDLVTKNKKGELKKTAKQVHSRILGDLVQNPPQAHVVIDGSPKKDKKLRAVFTFPDGRKKTTHFGGKYYSDYTIHNDEKRKNRYELRHAKREDWENFTTAGALSKWILWNKPSLKGSFNHFLALFSLTGELKVKTSLPGHIPARRNPRTPKGKKFPDRYLTGLNKVEKAIAMYEIDRGYEYDEDDPEAYKFWKSDIMAKARDMKVMPSKHRLAFIEKYGPLPKGKGDWLTRLSKVTGIKKSILEKIEDKGEAAWRVGHRPGVTQQQWARGRVYAFIMGADSSTGPGKPDNKLAIKAGIRNNPVKFMVDFADLPKTPHPNDEATMKELQMVMHQYENRVVPEELQDDADKITPLFAQYLLRAELPYDKKEMEEIKTALKPLILKLKHHFGRLRPHQFAKEKGIDFKGDFLDTAQTPEYPSGHSLQAYTLAHILSKQYPMHKLGLFFVADMVSLSRIDRGVHYPSAIMYSRKLAQLISEQPWMSFEIKKNPVFFDEKGKRIERCTCGCIIYESTWDGEPRAKGTLMPPPAGYCTCDNPQSIDHKYIHETREREFFGSEGGKREYARRSAGEPVPFPWESDYKQPRYNPLSPLMSGKAIEAKKQSIGRRVLYIPKPEDEKESWFKVAVGYSSVKEAKADLDNFKEAIGKHREGLIVKNHKRYNYAMPKGAKMGTTHSKTGGPKSQQQAIQTRKSDEGETMFSADPLLGESWRGNPTKQLPGLYRDRVKVTADTFHKDFNHIPILENPPKNIELMANGIGTIVGNQLSRELKAKGHTVNEEGDSNIYLEIIEFEHDEHDIVVSYPESNGDRHRMMAQSVALFVSNSTNLDVGVQPLDDLMPLGNRLLAKSSNNAESLALFISNELDIHEHYLTISDSLAKAIDISINPPEGMSVMNYILSFPVEFYDTSLAFFELQDKGYEWVTDNMKIGSYTLLTPFNERSKLILKPSITYLHSAHLLTEEQQEQVRDDVLEAAKTVVKKNPNHGDPKFANFMKKKREAGVQERIPQDIFKEAQQGNVKRAYEWLNTQDKKRGPQKHLDSQRKPKGQQKQGQQKQGQPKPKSVKNVFSTMSKDLIKSLTGLSHPKKKGEEKKDNNQKSKGRKGKNRGPRKNPIKLNPGTSEQDAEEYLEDFGTTMTQKEASRKFKKEKLRGKVGSDKLFMQLAEKVQDFGEASGWIKDGYLYHRPGARHLNEAMVSGYIMEDAEAFFHTHPRVWEPSQTSPDDFKVYHGLFTLHGIQDHFTVMGDRIDWFHFAKSNRLKAEEVADVIVDFEQDIEDVFQDAEHDHMRETDGHSPLRNRTKDITEAINKRIPEYNVRFKCYQMSPEQIRKSKA